MKEKASRKTDADLERLQYYDSVSELIRCLPAIVHPSHSVLFMVEAPTSKLRVILEMIDYAATSPFLNGYPTESPTGYIHTQFHL